MTYKKEVSIFNALDGKFEKISLREYVRQAQELVKEYRKNTRSKTKRRNMINWLSCFDQDGSLLVFDHSCEENPYVKVLIRDWEKNKYDEKRFSCDELAAFIENNEYITFD